MSYKQYSEISNLYNNCGCMEKEQPKVVINKCLEIKNIYNAGNTYLTNSLCYKPIILPVVNYDRVETRSPYDNRPWCSYK